MNYPDKLLYVFLFVVLLISSFGANAYQWETSLEYLKFETDDGFEEEENVVLRATWYFTPVSTARGPLAESAYLSQASSLKFGYGNVSVEQRGTGDLDGPAFELGAFYVVPGNAYFFGVNYTDISIEDGPGKIDQGVLDLQFGKYFTDTLSGFLAYADESVDSPPALADINVTRVTVGAKNILESNGKYINLEGFVQRVTEEVSGVSGDQTNTRLSLAGDYFFTPHFGLGALAEVNSGDAERNEGTTYGIDASYFFNPQFAVTAAYVTFDADNTAGRDADRLQLEFAARF